MRRGEEDIFNDVLSLFYLAKAYGFVSCAIKRNKHGRKHLVHKTKLYFSYSVLQAAILVSGYLWLHEFYKAYSKLTDGGLFFILAVLSELAVYMGCLVYCICSKVFCDKNRRFWQKLYELERSLYATHIILNHKNIRISSLIVVICTVASTISTNIFICWNILYNVRPKDGHILKYLAICLYYHYSSMAYSSLVCQYTSTFQIINEMLLRLYKHTERQFILYHNNDFMNRRNILNIARYYQYVCKVARDGNKLVSLPLLISYGQVFCWLTTNSFSSALAVVDNVYTNLDIVKLVSLLIDLTVIVGPIILARKCTAKVLYKSCKNIKDA